VMNLSEHNLSNLVQFARAKSDGFYYWPHSDRCWTVVVLYEDELPEWFRAHLSLDGRITLTPMD
jgi:hypothetical protein